ncbi:hypothetical protein M405DRAFT_484776 [Rhizopogon salebrosus TDB-379]|nr:hypothetical protein M405DRAFT_484776 [Rhizopogon salebrosus TDB-379]
MHAPAYTQTWIFVRRTNFCSRTHEVQTLSSNYQSQRFLPNVETFRWRRIRRVLDATASAWKAMTPRTSSLLIELHPTQLHICFPWAIAKLPNSVLQCCCEVIQKICQAHLRCYTCFFVALELAWNHKLFLACLLFRSFWRSVPADLISSPPNAALRVFLLESPQ